MYLKFGNREIGLGPVIWVTLALALIALVITIAVILAGRSVDNGSEIPPQPAAAGRFDWVDAGDLVFEDELARGTEIRLMPFRERRERWSESDAQEHWIDPRQIGIDVLEFQVNEEIRLILEDVP